MSADLLRGETIKPTWVWGLPISPVTMAETVAMVEHWIDARRPSYLVSANLNYAMLCEADTELDAINRHASLVLVDGMPLVWASKFRAHPLPERVAGSDLIFALADLAARRDFGVYFLGGAPGVAVEAAASLTKTYPGLRVVGVESPPFGPIDEESEKAILTRIRDSRADILIGAFSQPRGEKWIAANFRATGASLCVQTGASLDFAAGRVKRAPLWVRQSGLEWAFRLALEPRRLIARYACNAMFLSRSMYRDLAGRSRTSEYVDLGEVMR